MKRIFGLLALLASAYTFAGEGFLGTKTSGNVVQQAAAPESTSGSMPFIQMTIALVIVFGLLKVGLPLLMKKVKLAQGENSLGALNILSQHDLLGGKVAVVQIEDRKLLLGVTPSQINLLLDLTSEPAKVLTFQELVDHAAAKPEHEFQKHVEATPTSVTVNPIVDEQLSRLEKLLG